MKRDIFKSTVLIILAFALNACDSDWLQYDPLDQPSSTTFWKSSADFDKALTACYSELAGWRGRNNDDPGWNSDKMPFEECLTDNAMSMYGWFQNIQHIVEGSLSPTVGGYVNTIYNYEYIGIARDNEFLKQLAAYKGTDITDANKKVMEAEVRWIRGYYYWRLAFFYGDVPITTEPLTLQTQNIPKSTEAQVIAQALTDVDFAIENLPDIPYYQSKGHLTKSAALALKTRILNYTAYGNTGTPDIATLTQVKNLCLQIIPQYTLNPVWINNFRDEGQKNNNQEIIFSIVYLAPNFLNEYDNYYGSQRRLAPLLNFVNSFECNDGLAWGVSPLTNLTNRFENRDQRLGYTVWEGPTIDFGTGKTHTNGEPMPTNFGLKKFLTPENMPYTYGNQSQCDVVKFRLAEILLVYAEAQNEIAGPDASVYDAINSIRTRVNLPDLPAGLTKDEMRERIRTERRHELAFEEGLRYYDLKRWRTLKTIMNSLTQEDAIYNTKFEDKHYKWPLPQREIEISNGILIQNPDY